MDYTDLSRLMKFRLCPYFIGLLPSFYCNPNKQTRPKCSSGNWDVDEMSELKKKHVKEMDFNCI